MTRPAPNANPHCPMRGNGRPIASPACVANRRWLGLVLAAMTAVQIMLLGAGTALAATVPAAEAHGDDHRTEAQSAVKLQGGRPNCDSGLATGVVAESSLVESVRIALKNRYDGPEPIYDASVLFFDERTVVQVEAVHRQATVVPIRRHVGVASEGSVAFSGFVVAASTVDSGAAIQGRVVYPGRRSTTGQVGPRV